MMIGVVRDMEDFTSSKKKKLSGNNHSELKKPMEPRPSTPRARTATRTTRCELKKRANLGRTNLRKFMT